MIEKQTILVVDDEKSNVEFLVNNLHEKYNVKIAPNGDIALKILAKFNVDLVLLDIHMPVMDGYETIKEIKKTPKLKDIPVIFLTSQGNEESLVYGFELGAKDYIVKPFNPKELQVRVQNHIQTYELIKFINKQFSNFFGYKSVADFLKDHKCICEYFLEDDKFFHLGKLVDDESWIDALMLLPEPKRIVSMAANDAKEHFFSVSVTQYDRYIKLVSFTDITETITQKFDLEKKVIHDKLTGAYNREYFEQNYQNILSEYSSLNNKLAIAILDIDHFKLVNDKYGHDVGDEVLKEFVDVINENSRQDDVLIRWGGEEFIVLLKVGSKEHTIKALENLRKAIESNEFKKVKDIRCSIGASIYVQGENIKLTIKRADEALYIAKAGGRNQVFVKV